MFQSHPREKSQAGRLNGAATRAAGARLAVRSDQNGRDNNEDSFQVFELSPAAGERPLTVLAVADGMGGHEHGEDVSHEALRTLSLWLFNELVGRPSVNRPTFRTPPEPPAPETIARALTFGMERASERVRQMVKTNGWSKAGSTVVAAIVAPSGEVVAANLGDSPLFHFRAAEGRLTQITDDHTVAGVLMRARMITPEMARVHEGRSRLELYLGVERLPDEDPVYVFRVEPGDLLLLCSDGLSGALAHAEIERVLSGAGDDLEPAAERLITQARASGETDNQTLVLWRY
jgi:protein phosphatase